jgi:hypothetical protein
MRTPARRAAVAAALAPLVLAGAFAGPAEAKTRKPTCERGVQWVRSTPGFAETSRDESINTTKNPETATFTANRSGTIEVSASAGVEVETSAGFGAFSAGVKAQLSITASKSVTVEQGTSKTITIPARRRTVVRFGAATRKLRGYYVVDPNNLQDEEILFEGLPMRRVPGMPASCPLRTPGKAITAVVPVGTASKTTNTPLAKKKRRA